MYICMSIMLQNRGVLGMLPYFWPQHMLWELWHRMPFVAPMHHMQSALISSSEARGGKTFRSKTLGDDDLDCFFPFRNDSKGWDSWVCGVVKCAKHGGRSSWLETSKSFKGTLEIKSGGNWFPVMLLFGQLVAKRRGYNFSPRRNSGCGPISDAGGQKNKKRNAMKGPRLNSPGL